MTGLFMRRRAIIAVVQLGLCLTVSLALFETALSETARFEITRSESTLIELPQPAGLFWGLTTAHSGPERLIYERWQDWIKNSPELLGSTDYRNEPLIAGQVQALRVRYRTGIDLGVGSKITVLAPWYSGISFQTQDEARANYLSIRVDLTDASVVTVQVPAVVPFSHWFDGALQVAFEVVDAPIPMGTEIEFELGNLQLPGAAGPLYLPVAFSLPGEQVLLSGTPIELTIRPSRTERAELIGPSRLGRNEAATLELRLLDRFGNLSAGRAPSLDLIVNGNFDQRVDTTGPISLIPDIRFGEEGLNQAEIRSGGGGLRTISNPIFVQSGNKKIHWYDISPGDAFQMSRSTLEQGGTCLSGTVAGSELNVALPFVPTDERTLAGNGVQLVQIVAGDSQYEWFANRLLSSGFRVGFSGGRFSPLTPTGLALREGLTAALSGDEGGLVRGATYATTGARMVVQTNVNDAEPGSRVKINKARRISGWVQGTGPIDRIELIRNGEVIRTQAVAADPASKVVKISMFSDSKPIRGQRDFPRNGREWIGFVRTPTTELALAGTPGFRNTERQAAAQNGSNRVDFITWTHGGWSSLMVSLDEAGAEDEVLEVSFRQGFEDQDITPNLRQPSEISANRQMIPLFDLGEGAVVRTLQQSGYEDRVRLERVNPESPSYVEFSFSDASPFAEEDYYYVKIHQLDDHVAWTSPVFVGGFDPR
jgi:hypothetical protein